MRLTTTIRCRSFSRQTGRSLPTMKRCLSVKRLNRICPWRGCEISMRPLHIAFLTPEFPTEVATEGGLANYLYRMTRSLVEAGHAVEIFTLSDRPEASFDFEGAWVHRVKRASDPVLLSAWSHLVRGPLSIAAPRLHIPGDR